MESAPVSFVSGVLVTSHDPARLAEFYRGVLGLRLEEAHHEGGQAHFECLVGGVHFAIHPLQSFRESTVGVGSVRVSLGVWDLAAVVDRLTARSVPLLFPPRDFGFAMVSAVRDPDGNMVQFTQLHDAEKRELRDSLRDRLAFVEDMLRPGDSQEA